MSACIETDDFARWEDLLREFAKTNEPSFGEWLAKKNDRNYEVADLKRLLKELPEGKKVFVGREDLQGFEFEVKNFESVWGSTRDDNDNFLNEWNEIHLLGDDDLPPVENQAAKIAEFLEKQMDDSAIVLEIEGLGEFCAYKHHFDYWGNLVVMARPRG